MAYRQTSPKLSTGSIVVALAAVTLIFACTYQLLIHFTVFPVWLASRALIAEGFRFGKISGNQTRGYKVANLTKEYAGGAVTFNEISFHYIPPSEDSKGRLVMRDLSIQSVQVDIKSPIALDMGALMTFKSDAILQLLPSSPTLVAATVVEIGQIDIHLASGVDYKMNRLSVTGFHSNIDDRELGAVRLWLDSDFLQADLHDFQIRDQQLNFDSASFLRVQRAFLPDLLRVPLDVEFVGLIDRGQPNKLNLTAFEQKMTVNCLGADVKISFSDFTPSHYLINDFPIGRIDLQIDGKLADNVFKSLAIEGTRGTMSLKNLKFDLQNSSFSYFRAGRRFSLSLRPLANWQNVFSGQEPGFTLSTSDRATALDALSALYFAKPAVELAKKDRALVDRDLRYFTSGTDARRESQASAKAQTLSQKSAGLAKYRLPTSQAVNSGVEPPTTLPPFRGRHSN